jgi:hypothetical protein
VKRFVREKGAVVDDGVVTVRFQSVEPAAIESALRDAIALCQALSARGRSRVELLERNALEDDVPVRLRNLDVLQREYPTSEEARRASLAAVSHSSPELKLAGAAGLGDEAAGVMRSIAEGTSHDAGLRVEAVHHLETRCSRVVCLPILRALLGNASRDARTAALDALVRLRDVECVGLLERLAAREGAERPAVAWALGALGDASVEPSLLALLSMVDAATRIAAAKALSRVGTIAAVEPLLAYTTGLTADSELKRTARDAIAAIQSRAVDAEGGRLAIAQGRDRAGELSVSSEAGNLSLPAQEGDVSLTPQDITAHPPRPGAAQDSRCRAPGSRSSTR